MGLEAVATRFRAVAPAVDFWSLRLTDGHEQALSVRQGVLQPVINRRSIGATVTVVDRDGVGYAATSDLSPEGLRDAASRARDWAAYTAGAGLFSADYLPRPGGTGRYSTPVAQTWDSVSLADKIELLHLASRRIKTHARIVDWQASLDHRQTRVFLVTSSGGEFGQSFNYLTPALAAVANRGAETQRRTHGGWSSARQGGLEQLSDLGFVDEAERVAEEALALLDAPDCPAGTMDLLLLPGQMVLQIHESIGHPLELDRILGDERNYAGTSFVTPEMFGNYRYGSELLNITFDPRHPGELASYAFDDEGTRAERRYLIRNGILERPLGGAVSQARSGLAGVANARQCEWNRPPIDRMANLNLEPGGTDLQRLIGSVERGVLMDTNRSWSIDDSRNKFQFGCEYGRFIEDGELKGVVKNPNYRGIAATFWRSLTQVGDEGTSRVLGVSNCGKGEPNQMIHVGHASPACVFGEVDVFGAS